MKRYYVNKDAKIQDGQHEVHHEDCENLSNEAYNIYLGEFNTCIGALARAKRIFPGSNGCRTCCNFCHTREPKTQFSYLRPG